MTMFLKKEFICCCQVNFLQNYNNLIEDILKDLCDWRRKKMYLTNIFKSWLFMNLKGFTEHVKPEKKIFFKHYKYL